MPYINLALFDADIPNVIANADSIGTIWAGTRSGSAVADSLFICIDTPTGKAVKSLKLVNP
jgi:hypothetical protein